ncbi:hypothetical protein QZM64_24105 [Burkholderia cepacia]|uniref:hypothetical protein n=1 Tax=Burkholderia cepacia TaxID=292 RepID=UPI000B030235|nr:hypothetical protein [Burkholderia cepacia]MDN7442247.1 hypothetical protein [Burkholderia cepacia]
MFEKLKAAIRPRSARVRTGDALSNLHISVAAEGARPRRQIMTAGKVGGRTTYSVGV